MLYPNILIYSLVISIQWTDKYCIKSTHCSGSYFGEYKVQVWNLETCQVQVTCRQVKPEVQKSAGACFLLSMVRFCSEHHYHVQCWIKLPTDILLFVLKRFYPGNQPLLQLSSCFQELGFCNAVSLLLRALPVAALCVHAHLIPLLRVSVRCTLFPIIPPSVHSAGALCVRAH